jgi:hypothetical protein
MLSSGCSILRLLLESISLPFLEAVESSRLRVHSLSPKNLKIQFRDHPKYTTVIYVRGECALLFFVKMLLGQIFTGPDFTATNDRGGELEGFLQF